MPAHDPVVIAGFARTPLGAFQGELSSFTAADLGGAAIAAAVARAGLAPGDVTEVVMGCVLQAGQGQAPARQATIKAGLPQSVPATTLNKMCGSGLQAVMTACDAVGARGGVIVAGGMESMTNAPYLLDKARGGARMGHARMIDHMFMDGLEDAYERGRLMGSFADDTAKAVGLTRAEQDAFALASLERAKAADFSAEIAPLAVKTKEGEGQIARDEAPTKAKPEKIPTLKPAFSPEGTVTAANASSIADGAAAVVVMRRSEAEKRGLPILAEVRAQAVHAQKPAEFTLAPVGAIRTVLDRAGWTTKDVDLYEINEAFAVVTLAAMKALDLPHDKVNVNGGACALGHPIGASGARVLVTLLAALKARNMKRGVATLCIGGGEAVALAVERTA